MPITGANAKRVLFGAINLRTAHRVVLIRPRAGAADAQAFLRELRRRYRTAGTIWLLADRASAHTAVRTQMLAAALGIRFLWLPKQAPELNAMDQLWRELKRLIAANRQATSVNALASDAADWVLRLTPQQARRKAGKSSKKGPKKTAAEKKAASEEKAAGKKREQEVYNLFWGISEPDA